MYKEQDGTNAHTGLIRDHGTKEWYLFEGYTPELSGNNNIDVNDASFQLANIHFDTVFASYGYIANHLNVTGDLTACTNLFVDGVGNVFEKVQELEGINSTQNTDISIATNTAQAAFDKANNASSNTVVIQGVDATQNTRLTIIEGVDVTQNSNITVIQGVDVWQNTQITSINSLAQAAFNKANTGDRATASNTAPTGNTVGDLWLSLTDETLYMYSYDGVSNNWIDLSGPILISSNILVQYTITAHVM